MKRLNTQLHSEGAEFLVLGNLLIRRIIAYKAYTRTKGYDLLAVSPERKSKAARIQVKSRWATDAASFIINRRKLRYCDFVVVAKLNRGKRKGDGGKRRSSFPHWRRKKLPPDFFVIPVAAVKATPRTKGWGKIYFKNIYNFYNYAERWDLISNFLAR